MPRLTGKVAIITGAASGIGKAGARLFVAEGAKVVMTDLQDGASIAAELGNSAIFRKHDVTDEAGWAAVVKAALSHFGRLDVLINCAAIRDVVKPLMETSVAEVERSFRINTLGPMLGMKAAFEALKASGKGSIINVGSGNGYRIQPGAVPYSTSKFAIRGLTGCAASEWGRLGIRVNTVIPGMCRTPMHASTNSPEIIAQYEPMIPLGRLSEPEEVARAFVFLASDEASYFAGSELLVDGGVLL
jgi:3alpha(or 20beta)-hydroxysteroid dehydrogenase